MTDEVRKLVSITKLSVLRRFSEQPKLEHPQMEYTPGASEDRAVSFENRKDPFSNSSGNSDTDKMLLNLNLKENLREMFNEIPKVAVRIKQHFLPKDAPVIEFELEELNCKNGAVVVLPNHEHQKNADIPVGKTKLDEQEDQNSAFKLSPKSDARENAASSVKVSKLNEKEGNAAAKVFNNHGALEVKGLSSESKKVDPVSQCNRNSIPEKIFLHPNVEENPQKKFDEIPLLAFRIQQQILRNCASAEKSKLEEQNYKYGAALALPSPWNQRNVTIPVRKTKLDEEEDQNAALEVPPRSDARESSAASVKLSKFNEKEENVTAKVFNTPGASEDKAASSESGKGDPASESTMNSLTKGMLLTLNLDESLRKVYDEIDKLSIRVQQHFNRKNVSSSETKHKGQKDKNLAAKANHAPGVSKVKATAYEVRKRELIESASNMGSKTQSVNKCVESSKDILMTRKEMFQRRKDHVMKTMPADFSNYLLVWCPVKQICPEYIITILGKFDRKVDIRNEWGSSPDSSKEMFRGLIAVFPKDDQGNSAADAAARELSFLIRSVTVLRLDRLIDFILEAELRHPMGGVCGTRLLIAAERPFTTFTQHKNFAEVLSRFGEPTSLIFYPSAREDGTVCEVVYTHAVYAYAGYFFLNGFNYQKKKYKKYRATVRETKHEKEILKGVRRRLIDLLNENAIVPLC